MARTLTAEPVLDAHAELAEGPRWDSRSETLLWVDILGGRVHRLDPGSVRDTVVEVGGHVGAVAPRESGGLVAAMREGFATIDEYGGVGAVAPLFAEQPNLRFNDARADRAGRFWAGSLTYDASSGRAALYRLDPDHSVHTAVSGLWLANGLDWTPDDRLMYLVDTLHHIVDVFDFDLDSGSIDNRRRFLDVDRRDGSPDGLTVDAEGAVWVAIYGGGKVHRYTPEGHLDTVVVVPGATHVTSPGFGGSRLDRLFVTTALENLTEAERAEQPNAGGVLAVDPGVTGQPTAAFTG